MQVGGPGSLECDRRDVKKLPATLKLLVYEAFRYYLHVTDCVVMQENTSM